MAHSLLAELNEAASDLANEVRHTKKVLYKEKKRILGKSPQYKEQKEKSRQKRIQKHIANPIDKETLVGVIKKCTVCKGTWPIQNYSYSRSAKSGFQSRCKYCDTVISSKKATKDKTVHITPEEFHRILQMVCIWCNKAPADSVDRWDSDKPYIKFNVVPACKDCNTSKIDSHPKDFIGWLRRYNAEYDPRCKYDNNYNLLTDFTSPDGLL
jgi:hypothetical protein